QGGACVFTETIPYHRAYRLGGRVGAATKPQAVAASPPRTKKRTKQKTRAGSPLPSRWLIPPQPKNLLLVLPPLAVPKPQQPAAQFAADPIDFIDGPLGS